MKNLLILAGVAGAGYLIWKQLAAKTASGASAQGTLTTIWNPNAAANGVFVTKNLFSDTGDTAPANWSSSESGGTFIKKNLFDDITFAGPNSW